MFESSLQTDVKLEMTVDIVSMALRPFDKLTLLL